VEYSKYKMLFSLVFEMDGMYDNPSVCVQYTMGQQVCLMNPKNSKQRVAVGFVSGFGGIDTFYFHPIPDAWLKVDMKEVTTPTAALMYPKEDAHQLQVKHVLGGNTLWDERFIKRA
jgi:hypothetical protein